MVEKENIVEMRITPENLVEAGHDFQQASKDIQSIVNRLEGTMGKLEETWSDAGQQVFFQYYSEWRQHMGGFSEILDEIARQVLAIADRIEEIDKP
jgi:WXG100 family type VII secretion target